ncbi:MAG TPA: hypothetical protein VI452_06105 [Marmoricola sp.]
MRIAVVPSAPVLLPQYASLTDPVAEMRAAALDAVRWVASEGPVTVLADDLGHRVARHLLGEVGGRATDEPGERVLVVADGSARRGEKAPGHLDERAFGYDAAIGDALRQGDAKALAVLDPELGAQLLVGGVPAFRALGELVVHHGDLRQTAGDLRVRADVDYDADPYGVQYWVVRWQCDS